MEKYATYSYFPIFSCISLYFPIGYGPWRGPEPRRLYCESVYVIFVAGPWAHGPGPMGPGPMGPGPKGQSAQRAHRPMAQGQSAQRAPWDPQGRPPWDPKGPPKITIF